jgi:predicted transglutaminase-like cysteine proteinase
MKKTFKNALMQTRKRRGNGERWRRNRKGQGDTDSFVLCKRKDERMTERIV